MEGKKYRIYHTDGTQVECEVYKADVVGVWVYPANTWEDNPSAFIPHDKISHITAINKAFELSTTTLQHELSKMSYADLLAMRNEMHRMYESTSMNLYLRLKDEVHSEICNRHDNLLSLITTHS